MNPTISVSTKGPLRAAVQPWRLGSATWVTVIAKATCRLAYGEAVALDPEPIVFADAQGGASSIVSEVAPHKPRGEVVVTSRSAPNAKGAGQLLVAIDRGDKRVLLRRATLPYGASIENLGWGPRAASSPDRRSFLQGAREPDTRATVIELPNPPPWMFFQTAAEVQWIDAIAPADELVIERPDAPRTRTRLPGWQISASLSSGGLAPRRFPLKADTLAIEIDRLVASIVWRGALEIAPAELAALLKGEANAPRIEVTLSGFGPERAAVVAGSNGDAHATAPIDPKAIAGPVAPFLLKQLEARRAAASDKSATPWEVSAAKRSKSHEVALRAPATPVTKTVVTDDGLEAGRETIPTPMTVDVEKPAFVAPIAPPIGDVEPRVQPSPPRADVPRIESPEIASLKIESPRVESSFTRAAPRAFAPQARAAAIAPPVTPPAAGLADRLRSSGLGAERVDRLLARLHRTAEAPPPEDDG